MCLYVSVPCVCASRNTYLKLPGVGVGVDAGLLPCGAASHGLQPAKGCARNPCAPASNLQITRAVALQNSELRGDEVALRKYGSSFAKFVPKVLTLCAVSRRSNLASHKSPAKADVDGGKSPHGCAEPENVIFEVVVRCGRSLSCFPRRTNVASRCTNRLRVEEGSTSTASRKSIAHRTSRMTCDQEIELSTSPRSRCVSYQSTVAASSPRNVTKCVCSCEACKLNRCPLKSWPLVNAPVTTLLCTCAAAHSHEPGAFPSMLPCGRAASIVCACALRKFETCAINDHQQPVSPGLKQISC